MPSCPLATAVNGMAARLAREGHARASFIGKVSHELRTPLTVIRGYTYTLQRAEDDPAKTAKLDVITGECERLAYLIEDLLELSRARTGELRIASEAFALRDCVAEVSERLEPVAGQRDVRRRARVGRRRRAGDGRREPDPPAACEPAHERHQVRPARHRRARARLL